MKDCRNCGTPNREGEIICMNCGEPLTSAAASVTRAIFETKEVEIVSMVGRNGLDGQTKLLLLIRDHAEPIQLPAKSVITIGRNDPSNVQQPDIDLTRFNALERGVSRVHVILRRDDESVVLEDQGSSNGTLVNGQRALKGQPRMLRDGDEIRFGKLIAHIYFKNNA
jgi:pSer/pThr/pTyr-binding forkhead associated (FHA) protein